MISFSQGCGDYILLFVHGQVIDENTLFQPRFTYPRIDVFFCLDEAYVLGTH